MIPAIIAGLATRAIGGVAARAIAGKAVQSLGGAAARDLAANAVEKGASSVGTGMMMGNFSSGSSDGRKEETVTPNIYGE